jgi:hypothetical protein
MVESVREEARKGREIEEGNGLNSEEGEASVRSSCISIQGSRLCTQENAHTGSLLAPHVVHPVSILVRHCNSSVPRHCRFRRSFNFNSTTRSVAGPSYLHIRIQLSDTLSLFLFFLPRQLLLFLFPLVKHVFATSSSSCSKHQ